MITKKLAQDCTPESLRKSIEITTMLDEVTKNKVYYGLPEGYDEKEKDTCTYQTPTVAASGYSGGKVTFGVVKGTAALNKYILYIDEEEMTSGDVHENDNVVPITVPEGAKSIRIMVTDVNGASASDSISL